MSDITVGFGPDLAETPPRTCSWAVAQNNRSPPGQQKAITTGEGNRLRNAFHTQPAVAARKHGEVRQICGGHLFVGRRDFFFGLLFLFYAPRGCGFEPVESESGYVHRSEDVCYRVQLSLPPLDEWTKVLDSRAVLVHCQRIYSTVLNATHLSKGVIMGKLEGKVAVITGGATGIGRAAAKRFIEEGAFVFIFGRRQKELDAAVAELGSNARAVKGSVSDEGDLDRLYAAGKKERGTLDIVFANAGVGSQLKLGEITAKHIDETFDANVKGTIFTVQKALPLMGNGGSIVLTGSSAGTTGAPAFTAYSASKAAVRNLARTWAEDLKGTGIRVNVLSPGAVATDLAKAALGEEGLKAYGSMTALQQMGDPAEVAAAAFLASSDSSFMTATEVAVDGGLAQL